MNGSRERFREAVYVGNWGDAGLVNSLLEREGIETVMANVKVPQMRSAHRAVYVLNEAQLARAREIVEHYVAGQPLTDPKSYRSWRCRSCNELVEGQFDVCWKCGGAKGAS